MKAHSPVAISILRLLLFVSWASAQSNYWVANIARLGTSAFSPNASSYQIYRNVKDAQYGAKGDGVTDDTAAINLAIQSPGYRCGGGLATKDGGPAGGGSFCQSQTVTPALVYFPPGTYLVTGPIIMYYFTQLVGDALNPPTIFVNSTYTTKGTLGLAVMDANVYIADASGSEWYANQNNFYRQIRNFIIDMTQAPLTTAGIHWQVAQATSLQNITFNMAPKTTSNNQQQGIHMENGSGGYMGDLVFNGGAIGASLGNQQFTSRNMVFNSCGTAINMAFDWVWTFTTLTITDCDIGIDMTSGGFDNQAVGSVVVLDSTIGAATGIITPYLAGYSSAQSSGTLVIENVDFTQSPIAIANSGGRVSLAGGQLVASYAQGNAWTTAAGDLNGQNFNSTTCSYSNASQTAYTAQETTIQRQLAAIPRPSNLVDSTGKYFARSKPQYETILASNFLSAKASGCAGDGSTDDSNCVQTLLTNAAAAGKVAYFDHGAYVITKTINVPVNVHMTGECLAIIMASGSVFGDQNNPVPMFQVGARNQGQAGSVEMSDLVFETRGQAPGAIIVEWNIACTGPGTCGMWDVHWRIGGSAGTLLQADTCLLQPKVTTTATSGTGETSECKGAFLLLHVTPLANIYMENTWGWVADHELDMGDRDQVDIYNGRGFLFESEEGPIWLYGTAAEHSTLYNYQFSGTSNVFMGAIQQETAYFQSNPIATVPFTPQTAWNDPTYSDCVQTNCYKTWGLRILNSTNIFMYGGGLYSFFENWSVTQCLATESCQQHMVDIQNSSDVYLWALSTKGSQYMISYEGTDVVPYAVNKANFCECIVLFELAATD